MKKKILALAGMVIVLFTFTAAAPADSCACGGSPACVYFRYELPEGWYYNHNGTWYPC